MDNIVRRLSTTKLDASGTIRQLRKRLTAREVQEHVALWGKAPVIDAGYHVIDTYLALPSMAPNNGDTLSVTRRVVERFITGEDSKACFVASYGGREKSLLAIDAGLRTFVASLLKRQKGDGPRGRRWGQEEAAELLSEFELAGLDKSSARALIMGSADTIMRHYDEDEGLFLNELEGSTSRRIPTIFSNFAALSALLIVQRTGIKDISLDFTRLLRALLGDRFVVETDDYFYARQIGAPSPCLSSTAFLYRCFDIAAQLDPEVRQDQAWSDLSRKSPKTLRFVQSCWDAEVGAFSRLPGEQESLTIKYLWYGLLMQKILLDRGELRGQDLLWLKTDNIAPFILSHMVDAGFSDGSGEVPTVCAERFAAKTCDLLGVWSEKGFINGRFHSYREQIADAFANVVEFHQSCFDDEKLAYWPYPVSYLPTYAKREKRISTYMNISIGKTEDLPSGVNELSRESVTVAPKHKRNENNMVRHLGGAHGTGHSYVFEPGDLYFDAPRGFGVQALRRRKPRGYIVVIRNKTNRVERLMSTPSLAGMVDTRVYDAFSRRMVEVSENYRRPEFRILWGYGEQPDIEAAHPYVEGWDAVSVEEIT